MEVEELKKLDRATLVDMLEKHTSDYMRILKEGGTKEAYKLSKEMIGLLTKEIASRQSKAGK